jgi:hypothetical protein
MASSGPNQAKALPPLAQGGMSAHWPVHVQLMGSVAHGSGGVL